MSEAEQEIRSMVDEDVRTKLNRETGKVSWLELEKHFAAGNVVFVASELDLIEVAFQVSQDNKATVEAWITAQQLAPATDAQALQWHEENTDLWTVVVAPLVLVQARK